MFQKILALIKSPFTSKLPEVECSGCDGTGRIVYESDHIFVERGWVKPGAYRCPYCSGSGKLVKEK